MWYVYILRNLKKNWYYKGLTNDIDRRIEEHLKGKELVTRRMLPLELVHVEICDSRAKARELEKFFKSGYGRELLKEL